MSISLEREREREREICMGTLVFHTILIYVEIRAKFHGLARQTDLIIIISTDKDVPVV